MDIEQVDPEAAGFGRVRCRVCGQTWPTTPDQAALIAALFEHDAGHPGSPPRSSLPSRGAVSHLPPGVTVNAPK